MVTNQGGTKLFLWNEKKSVKRWYLLYFALVWLIWERMEDKREKMINNIYKGNHFFWLMRECKFTDQMKEKIKFQRTSLDKKQKTNYRLMCFLSPFVFLLPCNINNKTWQNCKMYWFETKLDREDRTFLVIMYLCIYFYIIFCIAFSYTHVKSYTIQWRGKSIQRWNGEATKFRAKLASRNNPVNERTTHSVGDLCVQLTFWFSSTFSTLAFQVNGHRASFVTFSSRERFFVTSFFFFLNTHTHSVADFTLCLRPRLLKFFLFVHVPISFHYFSVSHTHTHTHTRFVRSPCSHLRMVDCAVTKLVYI